MLRGHKCFLFAFVLSIALKQVIFSQPNAISNERELIDRWSIEHYFCSFTGLVQLISTLLCDKIPVSASVLVNTVV